MTKLLDPEAEVRFFEQLSDRGMDYFSLTLFDKHDRPIISHCNHRQWLDFYNQEYHQPRLAPPVQKYILASKMRVLTWDLPEIDKAARNFLQKRNEVVDVAHNVSILLKRQEYRTIITLGSKKKTQHIIDFLNEDVDTLLCIQNNLFL